MQSSLKSVFYLYMYQSSDRKESSSNAGRNNSGGAAAKMKTDFEDNIVGFLVQLLPPSAVKKSNTDSGNNSNPAARRYKANFRDDSIDDVGVRLPSPPPPFPSSLPKW